MRILLALIALVVLLCFLLVVGWAVTATTMDSGVQRYPAGSPEHAVAEASWRLAVTAGRRAVAPRAFSFLLPQVRITEVRRDPGHCTENLPHQDWRALARVYTVFRIPVRTLDVQCGGSFLERSTE
ncbi:MAG TPA: hypothetical protein VHQ65_08110 [Thermoanaerobaculia bacterium]|nr:hypothetical protein [Thermoanaerobaculia bacterium]